MKKVLSIGLGVLLAIGLALPVAADEDGNGLTGALEELYSLIAGWLEDDLDSQPLESESGSPAPEEQTNTTAGTPSGPAETAEMTPMILPGG
jgi:hypothetical protein